MSEGIGLPLVAPPQSARQVRGAAKDSDGGDGGFGKALDLSGTAERKSSKPTRDGSQAKVEAEAEEGRSKRVEAEEQVAEPFAAPLAAREGSWIFHFARPAVAQTAQAEGAAGEARGGNGAAVDGSKRAAVLAVDSAARQFRAAAKVSVDPASVQGKQADVVSANTVSTDGVLNEAGPIPAKAAKAIQAGGIMSADKAQILPDRGGMKGQLVEAVGADGRQPWTRLFADPKAPEGGVKVSVLSVQSAPAPALAATAHTGGQTAAGLVETLDANPTFKSVAAEARTAPASARGGVLHTIKIQLHPAHLGVVTAKLRLVGDQLAVELHTDSAEARHRLTMDSDTMAKALRSLGYEVDRVTVHQASQHGANAAGQGGARQQSFQSAAGNGGADGNGTWSNGESRDGTGERQSGQDRGQGQPAPDRSGLYI